MRKKPGIQVKLTTTIINNAEHMYVGEERQVAEKITNWVDDISRDSTGLK